MIFGPDGQPILDLSGNCAEETTTRSRDQRDGRTPASSDQLPSASASMAVSSERRPSSPANAKFRCTQRAERPGSPIACDRESSRLE